MLDGKLILVKLPQLEKHAVPNEVMSEGKLILVKLLQPSKQDSPNDVTLYVILLYVTVSGMTMSPE